MSFLEIIKLVCLYLIFTILGNFDIVHKKIISYAYMR